MQWLPSQVVDTCTAMFRMFELMTICHLKDALVSSERHVLASSLTAAPSRTEFHTDNIVTLPANESDKERNILLQQR